jgi:quercetin dioxygenase-like cupin family protein
MTVKPIKPVFSDARGDIIDIFEGPVHHTGIITFAAGAVRANHYHRLATQYTYMLTGRIELKTRKAEDPDAVTETVVMGPGDFVEVPAYTIHAYKALEPASMICLTTRSREEGGYEEDTVRVDPL